MNNENIISLFRHAHHGARVYTYDVYAVRGDVVEVMSDEGKTDDFCCHVYITNEKTEETWKLKHDFTGSVQNIDIGDDGFIPVFMSGITKAEVLVKAIRRKGVVNLDHWVKVA